VEPAPPIASPRDALVSTAKNRHSSSSGLQSTGKLLNNRRFTRSADSKITDADYETTERAFAENSFAIKIKPELHHPVVDERERVKDTAQNGSANAMTSFEDDIDPEFF
jgi:hypothetical protein